MLLEPRFTMFLFQSEYSEHMWQQSVGENACIPDSPLVVWSSSNQMKCESPTTSGLPKQNTGFLLATGCVQGTNGAENTWCGD